MNLCKLICSLLFFSAALTTAAFPQRQFKILFDFNGVDGFPATTLMFLTQGTDGNFYGTTYLGGSAGAGTVFKITPSGEETVLFNFCSDQIGNICPHGANPYAGVIQASDGNFYGTTTGGGQTDEGVVFRVTPDGVMTALYSFCAQGPPCADGNVPYGPVIQGIDGNLYGTTTEGGAFNEEFGGTVFKITLDGIFTTLHSFGQGVDGNQPVTGLIQATDGNFYGTTDTGGTHGFGVAYKLTPDGTVTTTYNFCSQPSCKDGAGPTGTLVQGADGNFYGPTFAGGTSTVCSSSGCGTIFKLTPGGTLTTLHDFCLHPVGRENYCPDGANPQQGLTITSNGYLTGTTSGSYEPPIIFALNPRGTTFGQFTKGHPTAAGLLQGTDGSFYGTGLDGTYGDGTVFSMAVGLAPFVKASPNLGPAGESVTILGTNLTGATLVTFNGTPAMFTVVSTSAITTTVPSGASTGRIKVTTPSGTLTSNLPFSVTH